MKNIFILTFLFVEFILSSFSAKANEQIVEPGKVWSYYASPMCASDGSPGEPGINHYAFGETVEVNGKTYYELEDQDNPEHDTLVCMRQDGEKVYMLVTESLLEVSQTWFTETDRNNYPPNSEILVYDFSLQPGDSYTTIGCGNQYMGLPDAYYGMGADMVDLIVTNVDYIQVNGKTLKRMWFEKQGCYGSLLYAVEGVGFNLGYLPVSQSGGQTSSSHHTDITFTQLSDQDGNVLFTAEDFDSRALLPLITEDHVWEYFRHNWFPSWNYNEIDRYVFDGTQEVNGKTYHSLKIISRESWEYDYSAEKGVYAKNFESLEMNEEMALLREEGGKVYMYMDEESLPVFYGASEEYEYLPVVDHEILLYDFTKSVGDTFDSVAEGLDDLSYYYTKEEPTSYFYVDTAVLDSWTEEYNSTPRTAYLWGYDLYTTFRDYFSGLTGERLREYVNEWSGVTVVEGVGNVYYGTLTDLTTRWERVTCDCGNTIRLNNMYDRSGNVVYPGLGVKNPQNAITAVKAENEKDSVKLYTIDGIEVKEATTPGLYLRKTSTSTEKILIK